MSINKSFIPLILVSQGSGESRPLRMAQTTRSSSKTPRYSLSIRQPLSCLLTDNIKRSVQDCLKSLIPVICLLLLTEISYAVCNYSPVGRKNNKRPSTYTITGATTSLSQSNIFKYTSSAAIATGEYWSAENGNVVSSSRTEAIIQWVYNPDAPGKVKIKNAAGQVVDSLTITFSLFPALDYIVNPVQIIASNATPVTINAQGTTSSYTKQWQQSADGVTWTDIPSATSSNYLPGALTTTTFFRRKVTGTIFGNPFTKYSANAVVIVAVPPVNRIRTWNILKPENNVTSITNTSSLSQSRITTQYLDGLGRLIQIVIKRGSYPTGDTATDMVNAILYDSMGREEKKYLAFAANTFGGNTSTNDGLFKLNPFEQQNFFYSDNNSLSPIKGQGETFYYGKTEYERSPLNRVSKTFAPGDAWINQNRGVETKYWNNTATDSVRIWTVSDNSNSFGSYTSSGMYTAGELLKTATVDETGNKVVELKDKEGQVILKKVQLSGNDTGSGSGHTGWLCTYYIYDNFNQLRAVIQPKGVELLAANSWNMNALSGDILNEQTFRYEYDSRGRMIMKKVPGAGAVYMVYDVRDRLVFSQDSSLRAQNKWLANLYDVQNRPVVTGLVTFSGSFSALQDSVGNKTTTPGSPNTGLPLDLTLTGSNQSGIKTAMRRIVMQGEFSTAASGEFKAILNPGPNGSDGETTVIEGVNVNKNPIPNGAGFEPLTCTFYDNYDWLDYYGASLTSNRNTSYDSHLLTASNTTFPYPQSLSQSPSVKGLVTGRRTKVLGTTNYLYSVSYYDDKARVIQVQNTNVIGGIDVFTSQYSFSGQPLIYVAKIERKQPIPDTTVIVTKNSYDSLWRVVKVEKKLSNTHVNSGSMNSYATLTEYEYNVLGQLRKKKIGNPTLDSLAYDYNIHGWLLGVNRHYAKDDHENNFFGFDLGYDKANNGIIGNQTYTPQYNGNISGTVWKSAGDREKRKYDYSYDAVNRLIAADFNQYTGSAFNKTAGVDFSVSGLSYDANGNIKSMKQRGLKAGLAATIDSLVYSYMNNGNSNLLLNVIDGLNDAQTKLGDFRTSTLHPNNSSKSSSAVDYVYDGNGNMVKDLNKDIITSDGNNGIVYNHLNLPQSITVKASSGNKGTITYTYDANGTKLKKDVVEGSLTTTTFYLNGLEYKNDTLQFVPHEEGRIRFTPTAVAAGKLDYDYFLKDHLGNVRMVITEQKDSAFYPVVAFEDTTTANEQLYFENANIERIARPGSFYTSGTNGGKVQLLQKNTQSIGVGKLLKVMAKDRLHVKVDYYTPDETTNNSNANGLNAVILSLSSLINNSPATIGFHGSGTTITNNLNSSVPFTDFLAPQSGSGGSVPKAYLNILFFDEQFKFVSQNSEIVQITTKGSGQTIYRVDGNAKEATKNGYAYIYVSNESNNLVYFDNLTLTHEKGPILEETHYYPFGLTMAGISSSALNTLENKRKFNKGSELQNKEFSDGSGLELYATNYRSLDPQLGRFWQVDPLSTLAFSYSTYIYCANNPISLNDPLGLKWKDSIKTKNGEYAYFNNPYLATVTTKASRKKSVHWYGWSGTMSRSFNKSLNTYSQRRAEGRPIYQPGDSKWYRKDVEEFNLPNWYQNELSAREFEKQFFLLYFGSYALPFIAPEIAAASPELVAIKGGISAASQAIVNGPENINIIGVAADAFLYPGSGAVVNGAASWRPFSSDPSFSSIGNGKSLTQAAFDFSTSLIGGAISSGAGKVVGPLKSTFEKGVAEFSFGIPASVSQEIVNQKLTTQK